MSLFQIQQALEQDTLFLEHALLFRDLPFCLLKQFTLDCAKRMLDTIEAHHVDPSPISDIRKASETSPTSDTPDAFDKIPYAQTKTPVPQASSLFSSSYPSLQPLFSLKDLPCDAKHKPYILEQLQRQISCLRALRGSKAPPQKRWFHLEKEIYVYRSRTIIFALTAALQLPLPALTSSNNRDLAQMLSRYALHPDLLERNDSTTDRTFRIDGNPRTLTSRIAAIETIESILWAAMLSSLHAKGLTMLKTYSPLLQMFWGNETTAWADERTWQRLHLVALIQAHLKACESLLSVFKNRQHGQETHLSHQHGLLEARLFEDD